MTEQTRAVIIDDRDSRIQLAGGWMREDGDSAEFNNQGMNGPVYRNTLLAATTADAILSFTFNGTKAEIFGTADPKFEGGSTVPNPDWECVLDARVSSAAKGASAGPGDGPINRWPFCTFSDLASGEHTIALNVRSKGELFWFDGIEYIPTDVVSGETIDAGQDDQDISYSAGWESYRGVAFITRVRESTVTFPFSGTGITLLGSFHPGFWRDASAGTYSIDGGSPVPFTIRGGGATDDYNRRLFEVSGLSTGVHTLVVTYQGSDRTMPLVVDRFFIEGSTNLRAQSLPTSNGPVETGNPGVSGDSGVPANTNRTRSVAIAVGITLGVLAVAVLLLLLLWLRRRRRIRLSNQSGEPDTFVDHSNRQSATSQPHTPTFSMSALSNTMLTHATAPHAEPRNKVRIMAPEDTGIAVLQHRDSGLRLSEGHQMQTVELPPSYSVR